MTVPKIVPPTDLTDATLMMPALFIGHGRPMNTIEDTEFSRAWIDLGRFCARCFRLPISLLFK